LGLQKLELVSFYFGCLGLHCKMSASSSERGKFLDAVQAKLGSEPLSDSEEEAVLGYYNETDDGKLEIAVWRAAGVVKGMTLQKKKRPVPNSARTEQEIPKQKAALSVGSDTQRMKFCLTIPGKLESQYLALPLNFDEEPTPTQLEKTPALHCTTQSTTEDNL
jgi:hypothetical protein